MRDEAAERYERGESSSSTLHSCLQKTRKGWTIQTGGQTVTGAGTASGQHHGPADMTGQRVHKQSGSTFGGRELAPPQPDQALISHPWTNRTVTPTGLCHPRRRRQEDKKRSRSPSRRKMEPVMEVRLRERQPRSWPPSSPSQGAQEIAVKGPPGTNAAATGVASGAGSQAGEAGDAVASQPQSRSLAQEAAGRPDQPDMKPPATAIALGALTRTGPKQLRRMLGRSVGRFDLPLSATTQMMSKLSSPIGRKAASQRCWRAHTPKNQLHHHRPRPPHPRVPAVRTDRGRASGLKRTRSLARLCPDSCVISPN